MDPNSLQLAKTIIQSRVDSLGVGESEVTSGDNQIIVTVPNVQQDELVRLVGQTAVLRFRAVYAAEQVQPPEPATYCDWRTHPGATAQPAANPLLPLTDSRSSVRGNPAHSQAAWQQQAAARSAHRSRRSRWTRPASRPTARNPA